MPKRKFRIEVSSPDGTSFVVRDTPGTEDVTRDACVQLCKEVQAIVIRYVQDGLI